MFGGPLDDSGWSHCRGTDPGASLCNQGRPNLAWPSQNPCQGQGTSLKPPQAGPEPCQGIKRRTLASPVLKEASEDAPLSPQLIFRYIYIDYHQIYMCKAHPFLSISAIFLPYIDSLL